MGQGKRAWIYCAIDAPEDRNGALKSQFKQQIDYGEQMGFELVGSSSDVGTTPLWNRNGFRHFIEAVQKEQIDVLLIVNRCRLSRSSMQLERFQIHQESKSAAIGKCFLCRMKITEKYGKIRWIENTGMVHQRLDFTYNNQQKPP